MNEKQYIREILKRIMLPRSVKNRIGNDLRSDIAAARELGESMEDIIARMGNPSDVAAEFNQNNSLPVSSRKKWAMRLLTAASVLTLLLAVKEGIEMIWMTGGNFMLKEAGAVGIIGGADGPTAIFVASPNFHWRALILLLLSIIGFAILIFLRKRKK